MADRTVTIGEGKYIRVEARKGSSTPTKQETITVAEGDTLTLERSSVPSSPQAPSSTIVGHGSATTGGGSTAPTIVTTFAAFKTAVEGSGSRVVKCQGTGWYDGGGVAVNIDNPNITILGDGFKGLKRAQLQVKASNVIIDNFRSWPGDQVSAPDDVDGISLLGPSSGFIENIAISRSSFFFAPDVSLTVLRDVRNWTIQDCMIGLGLYRSAHYEANDPGEDHSYAANFASFGTNPSSQPYGRNGTLWRNLILHSDGRMPNTWEFDKLDVINNVIYNFGRNGFVGNPRHMNAVNNIIRSGPQSTANAKKIWVGKQHDGAAWFPASVYMSGNVADGFTAAYSYGAGTQRTSVYQSLSVPATTPNLNTVLNAVGPTVRNSLETTMVNHVLARTSPGYYNGQGFPAPNAVWP